MPANTQPIFSALGSIQWGAAALTTANIAKDGTGVVTTVAIGNNAGNNAGNFMQRLVVRALGTNTTTVLRVFINNGGVNTAAANNSLIGELTLPGTTLSEISAQSDYVLPLNFVLPAGYKINVTLGTAIAAGYQVSAIGGQY